MMLVSWNGFGPASVDGAVWEVEGNQDDTDNRGDPRIEQGIQK